MGRPHRVPTSKYAHINREMLAEQLAAGKTVEQIAELYDMPIGTAGSLIRKHGLSKPRPQVNKPPQSQPKPVFAAVTPEQAAYIRENYGKVPRTQIARGLGVDKVTANNMILQLRLGG